MGVSSHEELVAPPTLTSIPSDAPSRANRLEAVYIGMVVPATVIVAVRLGWKYCQPKGLGLDDLCIFLAILLDLVHTGLGLASVQYGFGHHAVDIPRPDYRQAIMLWYVCQALYKPLVGFTKMALLFLYLRVFPQKWVQKACWAINIYVFLGTAAFFFASIFECQPIHKLWDRKIPGKCFNIGASWYAYAAFNTLADLIIIVLPLKPIWDLHLKWTQKAAISGVFVTGAFVCFTSIMRIVALPASTKTHEPTWGSVDAVTWAEIEGGVGIICACLPALRAPFVKLYQRLFGMATGKSSGNSNYQSYGPTYGARTPQATINDTRMEYWGDAIPLSDTQAQRTHSSDQDSEEKAYGEIMKTVDFRITHENT